MDSIRSPRIVDVDRLDSSNLIISFDDHVTALYSVDLLRSMLPLATIINDELGPESE